MANTFKFGNGNWASKKEAVLAYNDENSNFKPLPFTFDRASSATVVNKQGLIETVGTDEPRIDFLNNSKGHLLLEPSRQNIITYSEDFSQWVNISSVTNNANTVISPDGSQNASNIEFGATGTNKIFYKTASVSSGEVTASVYLKGTGTLRIYMEQSGGGYFSEKQITLSSEWVRHDFTVNATSTSTVLFVINRQSSSTATEVDIWGAQLEQGSYATSYIPTQGSAVTRSAETCNSAGNDSIFSEAEGVLYVESEALANDETSRVIASISNGSSNTNRIVLQYTNNVGGNQVVVFAQTPSGYSSVLTRSITNALTFNKFAVVYNDSTNNFDLWVNGTKIGDGSLSHSFTANTLTTIQLADGNATGNPFYGRIKEVKVYNTALTDAELIALTS